MSPTDSTQPPSQPSPEKKTGVIKLDKRRAGQCSVCFIAIDTHYVWRSFAVEKDNPAKQKTADRAQSTYDSLLCEVHAEERMKL